MRIGTFLMGGIAGAAAVIYFTRRSNWMSLGNLMQAGQSAARTTSNKSKSSWNESNPFNASAMSSNSTNTQTSHNTTSFTSGMAANTETTAKSNAQTDMSKVKEIVNEDPHLKVTVGEILSAGEHKESIQQNV